MFSLLYGVIWSSEPFFTANVSFLSLNYLGRYADSDYLNPDQWHYAQQKIKKIILKRMIRSKYEAETYRDLASVPAFLYG
jgi:hypothetical protein